MLYVEGTALRAPDRQACRIQQMIVMEIWEMVRGGDGTLSAEGSWLRWDAVCRRLLVEILLPIVGYRRPHPFVVLSSLPAYYACSLLFLRFYLVLLKEPQFGIVLVIAEVLYRREIALEPREKDAGFVSQLRSEEIGRATIDSAARTTIASARTGGQRRYRTSRGCLWHKT